MIVKPEGFENLALVPHAPNGVVMDDGRMEWEPTANIVADIQPGEHPDLYAYRCFRKAVGIGVLIDDLNAINQTAESLATALETEGVLIEGHRFTFKAEVQTKDKTVFVGAGYRQGSF